MGDVGTVLYCSSSSTLRRASWALGSVMHRSASAQATHSRLHFSRSVERSTAKYAHAAASTSSVAVRAGDVASVGLSFIMNEDASR
jgi:hypothetical protein